MSEIDIDAIEAMTRLAKIAGNAVQYSLKETSALGDPYLNLQALALLLTVNADIRLLMEKRYIRD